MNRKIAMPKKSLTASQNELVDLPQQQLATCRDVTNTSINADLEFEKLQNSAILTGKMSDQKPIARYTRLPGEKTGRKPSHYEKKYKEFEDKATLEGRLSIPEKVVTDDERDSDASS